MIGQETVNEFNTGGSHKVNPYRGVPVGGGNRVEEGETSVDFVDGKYIFSTKLFINNIDGDDFPMKLPEDLTFAEASMYIGDQFKEGGMIDDDTQMEILVALRAAQEIERAKFAPLHVDDVTEFAGGGSIDEVQNRMQAAKGIGSGLQAAGAVVGATGVGAIPGAAIAAAGTLVNVGTDIIGGNKLKKLQESEEALAMEKDRRANTTSPYAANPTTVFPYGGLLPYEDKPVQVPSDTTKTNAYTDTTLNKQMIDAIPSTLETKNDTLPQFTLPRRDTLKQYADGGPMEDPFGVPVGLTNSTNLTTGRSSFSANSQRINAVDNPIAQQAIQERATGLEPTKQRNQFFNNLKSNIGTEGIIGLGTQLASGIASNVVGLTGADRSPAVPRYDIAEERNPNLIYTDETRRAINRNQATQVQNLSNRSAGNIGAFASNAAAIGAAGSTAIGQSFIQQQQLNAQEQLATDQFNFRQRTIQARSDRQADDLDAANEGAYQNQRNAYRDALFANVSSFGETLNTIGQGDVYLDALSDNAKVTAIARLEEQLLKLRGA